MNLHRIAAGALVIKENAILLVRYMNINSGSYLAGPGGALQAEENAIQAIVRETIEETGVIVRPQKVVGIEDIRSTRYKMCKIWMLCDLISGEVMQTDGAKDEGIVQAGWFTRKQLNNETVYPSFIKEHDWTEFASDNWNVYCFPSRVADF